MAIDMFRKRADDFVAKWAERCQHRLTRETKDFIRQMAILLWKMESLGRKDATGFAAWKWRRVGVLLNDCSLAARKNKESDLRFAQITIRKVYGECSNEWKKYKPRENSPGAAQVTSMKT